MELNGVPASLNPEQLDQLCDLLAAKLATRAKGVPAFQAGCRGFESRLPLQGTDGCRTAAPWGAAVCFHSGLPVRLTLLRIATFAPVFRSGECVYETESRRKAVLEPCRRQDVRNQFLSADGHDVDAVASPVF